MKKIHVMTRKFITIAFLCAAIPSFSQFGYGLTASNDIYHFMRNPESERHGAKSNTAGSAILNFAAGPKIWYGKKKFSVSLEGQAGIGVLGFSLKENKGLGTAYFPVLLKFNFGGLSGFDREQKLGWSLGGGIQYSKTELYGTKEGFFPDQNGRNSFMTYVVQMGYGLGISGFSTHGFVRWGYLPEDKSQVLHVGLQYDFNRPVMKMINSPESSL